MPTRPAARSRWPLVLQLILVSALVLSVVGYLTRGRWLGREPANALPVGAKFHAVQPIQLDVKVNTKGDLQAVNNIEVMCMVEAGSTIVEIVKEGSQAKKGDVLVRLDSSAIRQKVEDTSLELQRATSDLTTAKEVYQIQEGQNAANLEAAEVDVEVAKLALREYTEGLYPQQLADAETKYAMAQITLANKESDLRQVKELYNQNFVTMTDVKAAELALTTVTNDARSAETALKVLKSFTNAMQLAGKRNYLAQSDQKLARTKRENASNLSKSLAAVEAAEQALAILKRRSERLAEQLAACTIVAPADGLVIYAQVNNTGGQPIQEGTTVRERQPLLRLPDTASMKAVIKVNESQVIRLAVGQRATARIVGIPELLGATLTKISPVADNSQRWLNPDSREYPVELTLDATPPGLKPGISVETEVLIDSIPNALAVPLGTLYSEGQDHFVFARHGDVGNPSPIRVRLGESNETHARIMEGLTVDDQVLLLQPGQGRELLVRAGMKARPEEAPERPRDPKKAKGNSTAKKPGGEKKPDGPVKNEEQPARPAAGAEAKAA